MRIGVVLVVFFAGLAPFGTAFADRASRLEELLIWKLSDELRLAAPEEKAFSDAITDLNRRRTALAAELEAGLESLKKAGSKKERADALKGHRKTLEALQAVPLEEFDRLRKILGDEKLAQYLEAKRDLAGKVKALLMEKAESADRKPLPPPKIIEDERRPALPRPPK